MALDSSGMAQQIIANLNALTEAELQEKSKIWNAICSAFVDYLTANAEITTTVATGITVSVDPNTGLGATTGTGTGSGTIS